MFAGDREWLVFGAIDDLFAQLDALYSNRGGLIRSVTWHLGGWFVGAIEVWVVLNFMGYPIDYGDAVIIESLMHAVRGAAFAVPGALGAQEGGLIVLCAIFGVPPEAALALSLVKRIPDLVIGVPGLLAWQAMEGWHFHGAGAAGRQSERAGLSGHDPATFCWSRFGSRRVAGCLFMIVAAALLCSSARQPSRPSDVGAGRDHPQAAAWRRSRALRKSGVVLRAGLSRPGADRVRRREPERSGDRRGRAAARRLSGRTIELVVEPRAIGSNPKVANLINMSGRDRPRHRRAGRQRHPRAARLSVASGRRARAPGGGAVTLSLLRHFDRQSVVAARATDHRQPFPAGRRGRLAAEVGAAVPRIDHRAASAIAAGDRRLRAARRLPGRRLCAGRAVARAGRAGFGAAVRGRPCLRRVVL